MPTKKKSPANATAVITPKECAVGYNGHTKTFTIERVNAQNKVSRVVLTESEGVAVGEFMIRGRGNLFAAKLYDALRLLCFEGLGEIPFSIVEECDKAARAFEAANGLVQVKADDKCELVNHCLKVNGKPFVVEYPLGQIIALHSGNYLHVRRDSGKLVKILKTQIRGYYA